MNTLEYKSDVVPTDKLDAYINNAVTEGFQLFGVYEKGAGSGMWLVMLVRVNEVKHPGPEAMAMKG